MKIYLATPYSHDDPEIREKRFLNVTKMAGIIMAKGHIVYSPITQSHLIAKMHDLPVDWEYWKKVDTSFIEWCEELWVFRQPGVDESVGVTEEILIANKLNKPVRMIGETDNES